MTQKISNSISTSAVVLSPFARVIRTIGQIAVALAAAIPTILNTPGVSGNAAVAKYAGIITGYLVLVTTIVNTLEHFGAIPVLGGKAVPAQVPSLITE